MRDTKTAVLELEPDGVLDMTVQLPLSDKRDELDAIAHAVNVLSDELRYAGARMAEAERRRVDALLKEKDQPQGP